MTALDELPLSRKQIISIVESEQSMLSIWAGAVRSGKTIAAIMAFFMAVDRAAQTGMSGEIVIVGRTLQTIERNILGPMMDPSIFGLMAHRVHHTRGSGTARVFGRTVHLIGANDVRAEHKVRGMTVALSMVDEATLVPEDFWNMLRSRHSVRGARMLATTNPDSRAHWLRKEWLLKADEKNLRSWDFTLDDNPFLDPGFVEGLKRDYAGLWYKRFILGEWVMAEGAVYDMWDPDRHVVSELPRITRWLACGVDYGTANVFAALMLGRGDDGSLYFTNEWRWEAKKQFRQLTDVEYVDRIKGWMGGIRPDFVVVDPSASSLITQLLHDRISAIKGDNEVLDGIRLVSSLLATNRLKVHESCVGFIDEVTGYAWDDDKLEKGEEKPIKAEDHSLDAARYAIKTTEYTWTTRLRAA